MTEPRAEIELDAYDRGHTAGRIEARLAGHDDHFRSLNGTTSQLVGKVDGLLSLVQRLGDQAIADAATRVQLAEALAKADDSRRIIDAERRALDHDQQARRTYRMSPFLLAVAVGSSAVAAVTLIDKLIG